MLMSALLALVLSGPAHAREKRERTAAPDPGPAPALVAIVREVLPTATPPADTAPFTCEVSWEVRPDVTELIGVNPGCPMASEVEAAARQWQFGYVPTGDGTQTIYVSARFAYGALEDGQAGWVRRVGPEPVPGRLVEVPLSKLHFTHREEPQLPSKGKADGSSEQVCSARITLDDRGVPRQVEAYGCDPFFERSVAEAAVQWRVDPTSLTPGVENVFTLKITIRMVL